MSEITLDAVARIKEDGNINKVRTDGKVPAVLYGQGKETSVINVDYRGFEKAFLAAGASTIIKLVLDGKEVGVLVKEVQKHPVTEKYLHVDFYEVDMNKEITANVPLVYGGVSKAVKDDGGTLVTSVDEVEVTCLPANLPKEIKVDISSLKTFEDVLKIKDLVVPEKVTITNDKKDVIATVMEPRSEEEMASLDEEISEDVTEVEGVEKEDEELEATESEAATGDEKKDEKKEDVGDKKAEGGDKEKKDDKPAEKKE